MVQHHYTRGRWVMVQQGEVRGVSCREDLTGAWVKAGSGEKWGNGHCCSIPNSSQSLDNANMNLVDLRQQITDVLKRGVRNDWNADLEGRHLTIIPLAHPALSYPR